MLQIVTCSHNEKPPKSNIFFTMCLPAVNFLSGYAILSCVCQCQYGRGVSGSGTAFRTTERRLGAGGGGHNRLLEPQTVNFPQNVIRSYTPACAKPLVSRSAFSRVLSLYTLFSGCIFYSGLFSCYTTFSGYTAFRSVVFVRFFFGLYFLFEITIPLLLCK